MYIVYTCSFTEGRLAYFPLGPSSDKPARVIVCTGSCVDVALAGWCGH